MIRNMQESASGNHPTIKCVVWDLDNTLWPGVAIEGSLDEMPEPDASMLAIIETLEERGIVSSVASRNDPALGEELLARPMLAGRFVAPQVSWEPKSHALRRIAEQLNMGLDAVAFVDDSPFERAEVTFMLPEVLALSPEQMLEALDGPMFNPGRVTTESLRRAEMYRAEERRKAAEEGFGGSRMEFLKWCEMRLQIAPATLDDLERIVELTERTHQLNSTGRQYSPDEIRERIESIRWLVPTARLTDRFGDYGMIGAAVVDRVPPTIDDGRWTVSDKQHATRNTQPTAWLLELVMLSCRVEGRGIPAALLRWLMAEAQEDNKDALRAVYKMNPRNLPMRMLFRQMGFKVVHSNEVVLLERDLSAPLPPYPEWLEVRGRET